MAVTTYDDNTDDDGVCCCTQQSSDAPARRRCDDDATSPEKPSIMLPLQRLKPRLLGLPQILSATQVLTLQRRGLALQTRV